MDENMQNVEKTYSQAEVDALLQQESDRRVSSALKKQEEKLHKEFETKQREAEKLRSMNENEKFVYELE
jgi:flagellar motor switch protein FliM